MHIEPAMNHASCKNRPSCRRDIPVCHGIARTSHRQALQLERTHDRENHNQLHPKEASGGWTVPHLQSIRFRSRDPSQSSMGFRRKTRRPGKENPRNRSVRLGMFARNGNLPGWQSPRTVSLPYPNFRFHMNRARKLSEGGFRMLFWQPTREGMFSNSRLIEKNLN